MVNFCLERDGNRGRKANIQADRPTLSLGEIRPRFRSVRSNSVEPDDEVVLIGNVRHFRFPMCPKPLQTPPESQKTIARIEKRRRIQSSPTLLGSCKRALHWGNLTVRFLLKVNHQIH